MWTEIYRSTTGVRVEIDLSMARFDGADSRFRVTLPSGETRQFADLHGVLTFVADHER